jgi:leucyl/phenylalanyl-tRNA---protein transferase
MTIYRLGRALAFPPVDEAGPGGLLAVGGDLSPQRLLLAYATGIFPWYSAGQPILWYAPDPRFVLNLDELVISRSLRKTLRRHAYDVRIDTAFERVVQGCSTTPRPGQDGTWITAEMRRAYSELHRLGFAHSVETYAGDVLVGGLYGVSLGRAFFGESMFSIADDASKVALCHLVAELRLQGFHFLDCQVETPLFASLGAKTLPRRAFGERLSRALLFPTRQGPWTWSTATGEAPDPLTPPTLSTAQPLPTLTEGDSTAVSETKP